MAQIAPGVQLIPQTTAAFRSPMSSRSAKAMILAAGRGERMRALTSDRPKPLLEIGNESLIERHLRRLAECGTTDVVINLSYRGAQIREHLGDGARWDLNIEYSEEGEPPLETGGGIVRALPMLGSQPFLLINADVLTDFDFSSLRLDKEHGVLVLVPRPAWRAQGDFGLDGGSMVVAAPPSYVFAGVSMLDPVLFEGCGPGRRPLKPILDAAIARRSLRGELHEGLWSDVGTPERLREARRFARASASSRR